MWIEEMIDASGRPTAEVNFESDSDYVVIVWRTADGLVATTLVNPAKLSELPHNH